jgi:hypothetical protein
MQKISEAQITDELNVPVEDIQDKNGNSIVENKVAKVATAEQGIIADSAIQGIQLNGNTLQPSGEQVVNVQAATPAQGTKADSAIQGVSFNGTALTPDSSKKVNIQAATVDQGNTADTALQGVSLGGTELTPDANKKVDIPVDTDLSTTSVNPVQNKVVNAGIAAETSRATAAEAAKVSDVIINGSSALNTNKNAIINYDDALSATSENAPQNKAVKSVTDANAAATAAVAGRATALENIPVQLASGTTTLAALVNGLIAAKSYVDNALAAYKGLKPNGFIQTTAPTQGLSDGDLWINADAKPTTYPVQAYTYTSGAWSTTTSDYTPQAGDVMQLTDSAGATSTLVADANGGWITLGGSAFNPDTKTITLNQAEQATLAESTAETPDYGVALNNIQFQFQERLNQAEADSAYQDDNGNAILPSVGVGGHGYLFAQALGHPTTLPSSDWSFTIALKGSSTAAYTVASASGVITIQTGTDTPLIYMNADGSINTTNFPAGVWPMPDGTVILGGNIGADEKRVNWLRSVWVTSLYEEMGKFQNLPADLKALLTDKTLINAISVVWNQGKMHSIQNFDFNNVASQLGTGQGIMGETAFNTATMEYPPTMDNGFNDLISRYTSGAGNDTIYITAFEHDTQNVWSVNQYRDHTSDAASYTLSGTIIPVGGGAAIACNTAKWLPVAGVLAGSCDLETIRSHGLGLHIAHYEKGTTGLPFTDGDALGITYTANELDDQGVMQRIVHIFLIDLKTGTSYTIKSNGSGTKWIAGIPDVDMWHSFNVEDKHGNEWTIGTDGNAVAPDATRASTWTNPMYAGSNDSGLPWTPALTATDARKFYYTKNQQGGTYYVYEWYDPAVTGVAASDVLAEAYADRPFITWVELSALGAAIDNLISAIKAGTILFDEEAIFDAYISKAEGGSDSHLRVRFVGALTAGAGTIDVYLDDHKLLAATAISSITGSVVDLLEATYWGEASVWDKTNDRVLLYTTGTYKYDRESLPTALTGTTPDIFAGMLFYAQGTPTAWQQTSGTIDVGYYIRTKTVPAIYGLTKLYNPIYLSGPNAPVPGTYTSWAPATLWPLLEDQQTVSVEFDHVAGGPGTSSQYEDWTALVWYTENKDGSNGRLHYFATRVGDAALHGATGVLTATTLTWSMKGNADLIGLTDSLNIADLISGLESSDFGFFQQDMSNYDIGEFPGLPADIINDTVNQERYGYITGWITYNSTVHMNCHLIQYDHPNSGKVLGEWTGWADYNNATSTWPTSFTWSRAETKEVDAGTYTNAQAGFDIILGNPTIFTKFTMRVESYASSDNGSAEIRFDNAYAGGTTPVVNAVIKYNTLSKLQIGTFYVNATDGLLHLWVPYATTASGHLHVNIIDCQTTPTNEGNYSRLNATIAFKTTALDLSAITNKVQITLVNKITTSFSFGSGTATVVKQDNVVSVYGAVPANVANGTVLGTLPLTEYYPAQHQFVDVLNGSGTLGGHIQISSTNGQMIFYRDGAAMTAAGYVGTSYLAATTVGGSTSASLSIAPALTEVISPAFTLIGFNSGGNVYAHKYGTHIWINTSSTATLGSDGDYVSMTAIASGSSNLLGTIPAGFKPFHNTRINCFAETTAVSQERVLWIRAGSGSVQDYLGDTITSGNTSIDYEGGL